MLFQNRYGDLDYPETCPCCGADNWDEPKQQWVHRSEVFCSDSCEFQYSEWQRADDEHIAADIAADELIHAEYQRWKAENAAEMLRQDRERFGRL